MKKLRVIAVVLSVIIILWAGMLVTDTVRSQNFQEPVFAKEIRVEADNNTIVYQGICYTVEREFFENQNGENFCGCSEVYLFGKPFAAVIT